MINRTYPKDSVLLELLHKDLEGISSDLIDGVGHRNGIVKITLQREPTTTEDIQIRDAVLNHIPSDSYTNEKQLTDTRNSEGFDLYKRIFAHISDNEPITNIDAFIVASEKIHRLRNYLKDGNFETAIRYMELNVKPIAMGENGLFPTGYPIYRDWVREISLKYNPILGANCEVINPAFAGSPFEGVPFIDYIELAPQGMV